MCMKDGRHVPDLHGSSTINKKPSVTLKPARKTRTKTRRPKFLSLRLEISPENTQQSGEMTKKAPTTATATAAATHRHHQLNLFPLHPENLVEDKDTSQDENVANFFYSADGGATATLTTLLGAGSCSSDNAAPSPSLTYAYGACDGEEGALARTALRSKERTDTREERWVCYSEVVETKEEEVSSCTADVRDKMQTQGLSLKLDYQEVMNAWSGKGPLYIQLESPQTVPDLRDEFLSAHEKYNGVKDGWGSNGGLWTVPENSISRCGGGGGDSGGDVDVGGEIKVKVKEEEGTLKGGEEYWKVGAREASVLRYKEKRQNRLFSKRIRYQVRKINAEKRPRLKGRFVKRS
ncbi:hypothetical protein U1Q18_041039 [Sarracenia purpurea var. burkii]